MATIDYKEKYEQALEKARQLCAYPTSKPFISDLQDLFPELMESEDERMKKIISDILLIDSDEIREILDANNVLMQNIDAWLEKQGEQKPADKVEPKFKAGDWVVNKGHSYLIADIDFLDKRYLFEIGGYTHEQLNWEYIENTDNKYHLWTIQDAKDGDVLMSRAPFIYGRTIPYGGLDWYNGKFIKASNYVFNDSPVHPATKEQRNLLFLKMKEAGYEWDAEKKELKKIEQMPADEVGNYDHKEVLQTIINEQKPTWSEEDEELLSFCCAAIELSNYSSEEHRNYAISFLESLKDRVQPQQKQFTIKFDEESPHTSDEISKNGYVDMNRPIELTIQDEPVFDGMVYEYIKSKEKAGITGKELTAYRQGLEDMWNKLKSK